MSLTIWERRSEMFWVFWLKATLFMIALLLAWGFGRWLLSRNEKREP